MNYIPQPFSPISMAETSSYNYTGNCMSSDDDDDDEEEDMANCLIMLAHSTVSPLKQDFCSRKPKLLKIRSVTEMTGTGVSSGFECKTCNRVFPSFQALGGHRASHKKPKLTDERGPEHLNIKLSSPATYDYFIQTGCNKNSKPKVHECLICSSEFLSGQALGGHMRRHRVAPMSSMKGNKLLSEVTTSRINVMEKSPVMCLDLNFPPPEVVEDGDDHSSLGFASKQEHVLLSAASLVDCHY